MLISKIFFSLIIVMSTFYCEELVNGNEKKRKKLDNQIQELIDDFIISKVDHNETREYMEKYKKSLKWLKAPDQSIRKFIKTGKMILRLKKQHLLMKSNPLIAKFIYLFCKSVAMNPMDIISKDPLPKTLKQAKKVATVVTHCFEVNNESNYLFMQLIGTNNSLFGQNLRALYNGYMRNDASSLRLMLNITMSSAKALANTLSIGQNASMPGDKLHTFVMKDTGVNLAKTKITVQNCSVIPSSDFSNSNHSFDVLVSAWTDDIMKFNENGTLVGTHIVSIQFWHSMCKKRIQHFKAPAHVFLAVKKVLPYEYKMMESRIAGKKVETNLKIYRVTSLKGSVLHVNFYNLSSSCLDVIITKSKFPSIDDFNDKNVNKITENKTYLMFPNTKRYNIWVYIAILPCQNSKVNSTLFNITFISTSCLIWDEYQAIWHPACGVGKNHTLEMISCRCRHFSVFAGLVVNIPAQIVTVTSTKIELELQLCNIIFITMAITFGIYCLLLILASIKRSEGLYYLADNFVEDRYAYLLVVRTEKAYNAGTTSHAMIKLIGSKRSTMPHVLNFPDEDMHILQKGGQDMFVLTTSKHLGDLKHIELWIDCVGPSPSWYCRDILVFDMQSFNCWYFKIKTRFDVMKHLTYLVADPTASDLKNLKFFQKINICNRYHTWLLWSFEPNFSFTARLTVVLSTVLMTYMFVLMHLGMPTLDMKDCLDKYEYYYLDGYAIYAGFMSSLIAFIVHIGIAWTFRFSNIEVLVLEKEFKTSHQMSGVAWVTLAVLILISATFLIIFGFWVPVNSSLIWLTCSAMSIILNTVVYENLFIIIQARLCKYELSTSFLQNAERFLLSVEKQRQFLYNKFGDHILRPFLEHLYTPLKRMQLKQRRLVVELRHGIHNDLLDLVLYGVYNIILYVVILFNKADFTLESRNAVADLMDGSHVRNLEFSSVTTPYDMYKYMIQTMLPTMYPETWYSRYAINETGMMSDFSNKFIGVPRLRQHRVFIPGICNIHKVMEFMNMTCSPEYSIITRETRDFSNHWKPFDPAEGYSKESQIWRYQPEGKIGTLSVVGKVATYSGGGYVAFLGRKLLSTVNTLINLYQNNWIDHTSRVIFIEFLTYNVNYNMFNAVRLMFEQSATGYVRGTIQVHPVRMLHVESEEETTIVAIVYIFIFWWFLLMIKLIRDIAKAGWTFYKRFWLMMDLLINLMSITSIVTYVFRTNMIHEYLDNVEAVTQDEFVSYFSLFYVEEFLTMFSAILVGLATTRIWRFLRFGLFFKILERTLSMAATALLSVTLAFFVILLGFGLGGLLIFGNDFPELSTLIGITATLVQLTMKPEDFPLKTYAKMDLGYAYFSSYLILMQIILFVYVTVVIMAYTKAQLEFSSGVESFVVKDYIREKVLHLPKLIKHKLSRLKAGYSAEELLNPEDEIKNELVTPKADEFRYANCLGIPKSRMQSMRFIVSCVVMLSQQTSKERETLTEYEAEMALGVCKQFVLKTYEDDEVELFFKGHFEGEKRMRIVEEKRITKIAEIVRMLLEDKDESREHYKLDPTFEIFIHTIKLNSLVLKSCNLWLKLMAHKFDDIEKKFTNIIDNESK